MRALSIACLVSMGACGPLSATLEPVAYTPVCMEREAAEALVRLDRRAAEAIATNNELLGECP